MRKIRSVKEAIEIFLAHSEAHGVRWPAAAEPAFVAGMAAAFTMAHNNTDDEIEKFMAEALAYAIERRMAQDSGVMPA
jgi:hypothetical protein